MSKQEQKDSAIVYIVLGVMLFFIWDAMSNDIKDPTGDGWNNTIVHKQLEKRGISQKIEQFEKAWE